MKIVLFWLCFVGLFAYFLLTLLVCLLAGFVDALLCIIPFELARGLYFLGMLPDCSVAGVCGGFPAEGGLEYFVLEGAN